MRGRKRSSLGSIPYVHVETDLVTSKHDLIQLVVMRWKFKNTRYIVPRSW